MSHNLRITNTSRVDIKVFVHASNGKQSTKWYDISAGNSEDWKRDFGFHIVIRDKSGISPDKVIGVGYSAGRLVFEGFEKTYENEVEVQDTNYPSQDIVSFKAARTFVHRSYDDQSCDWYDVEQGGSETWSRKYGFMIVFENEGVYLSKTTSATCIKDNSDLSNFYKLPYPQ